MAILKWKLSRWYR
uniref:E8 n=1 Tax=Human papillomavirus type 16 TaxID=333760 RepID=A0A7D7D5E2_HPV16|nr:E8 [Human papillomavirus 16]QMJ53688.1 E8 [Human papillomavirus 16]QMJ53784.1 E8 [Human papillomavirus 16]QMJ53822.1 E8 [Human papillomavirus 16]QMJ53840.1 E8 [Human papillomavirus 16]